MVRAGLRFTAFTPRIAEAEEVSKEELIAPMQFFIAVQVYAELMGAPEESDIHYKKFHGETLAGVPWQMGLVYHCPLFTVYRLPFTFV